MPCRSSVTAHIIWRHPEVCNPWIILSLRVNKDVVGTCWGRFSQIFGQLWQISGHKSVLRMARGDQCQLRQFFLSAKRSAISGSLHGGSWAANFLQPNRSLANRLAALYD